MDALPLTGKVLHKAEIDYHGKCGQTLVRIQHISIMSVIVICYATCCLATQNMAPTLPGFQGIKCYVLNSRFVCRNLYGLAKTEICINTLLSSLLDR